MTTFGKIKSKVEYLFETTYKTEQFKKNVQSFKKLVLENKELSEIYFIYDELSSKKNMNEGIVDDYINESFEILKSKIEKNATKINDLSLWIDSLISEKIENHYDLIDTVVYESNKIKSLESVVSSKNKIKNLLLSEEEVKQHKEIKMPISSMVKIANKTLKNELVGLTEDDKKELEYYSKLSKKELEEEITSTKQNIIESLSEKLIECEDDNLKNTIKSTISELENEKFTKHSLYRIKNLEKGLL